MYIKLIHFRLEGNSFYCLLVRPVSGRNTKSKAYKLLYIIHR